MAEQGRHALTLPLLDDRRTCHVQVLPQPTEEAEKADFLSSTPSLEWSYSKHSVLEQCPRNFYYQYYGANQRKAKEDPDKEHLRRLKTAVNRHTRTGEILHLAIADYLRKAQQNTPWKRQDWLGWASKIFERDITRSREGWDAPQPSAYQHPPKFLVEFLCEPEAREMCREAKVEMLAALEKFLDAPQIAVARQCGMQPGAHIEVPFYRLQGIPFKVRGQVDLVYPSERGEITIVDWKSGDELEQGDDSLQLAFYALWARERFTCDTDAIRIYKAYLGSGDLVEFPLSESLLKRARFKVLHDAGSFARMDGYGRVGNVEAFTPCVQEDVCRGCVFVLCL